MRRVSGDALTWIGDYPVIPRLLDNIPFLKFKFIGTKIKCNKYVGVKKMCVHIP
jgi:hypothetical protein